MPRGDSKADGEREDVEELLANLGPSFENRHGFDRMAAVDQFLDDLSGDGLDEAPASWKSLKPRSLATLVMAAHEAGRTAVVCRMFGEV